MILSLIYFITLLTALALIGRGLQFIFTKTKQFSPESVFYGILFSVPVYALIKTSGKTEFIVFIIACVFLLLFKKSIVTQIVYQNKTGDNLKRDWGLFYLFAVIYFIAQYFLWTDLDTSKIAYPTKDLAFYGRLAGYLNLSGQENNFISPLKPEGVSIYHFGDIWLSSILSIDNFINPTKAFLFYQIPLLLSLIGFYSFRILNHLVKAPVFLLFLIALLVPVLAPFSILYPNQGVLQMDVFASSVWMMPKLLTITLFVLVASFYAIRKQYQIAFLILWALIFFYLPIAPAIISFCVVSGIYLYKNGTIEKKSFIKSILFLVISCVLLGLFYYVFRDNNSPSNKSVYQINFIQYIFSFDFLKTMLNSGGKAIIQMLFTNSILIILIIIILKRNYFNDTVIKHVLFSLVALILLSAIIYSVFHFITDSVQFWTNIYIAVIPIVNLIVVCVLLMKQQKLFTALFLLLQLVLNMPEKQYETIDKKSFEISMEELKDKPELKAAVFLRPKNYVTVFQKNTELYPPFPFISLINPSYYATNVGTHQIPLSQNPKLREIENRSISSTPFELYVKKSKNEGAFIDHVTLQTNFIKEHKINYIISDTTLSSILTIDEVSKYTSLFEHNGYTLYKRIN